MSLLHKAELKSHAAPVAILLALGLATGLVTEAAAQNTQVLPSREQLNPAQLSEPEPDADEDAFSAPQRLACAFEGQTQTLTLSDVKVDGLEGVTGIDLTPAISPYVGRQISLPEICAVRDRVASVLFQNGILARVQIEPQNLSGGVLTLSVTTAKVVGVYVKGDGGPARAKVADYIEHLRNMEPFDLRKAQRYLLLASEVPGVRIQASLRPAETGGDGAVDFYVTIDYDPFNVIFSAQNSGSEPLGPESVLARIDINGLTGWGDRTSLIVYSSIDGREQNVLQLVEEIRPGSEGLVLRASASYGVSRPGGALAPLDLEGASSVLKFEAEYPVIRSRQRDLIVSGGIDIVSQNLQFINSDLYDDKLRVLFVGVRGRQAWRLGSQRAVNLELTGDVEIRKGLNAFGASQAGEVNLSRFEGDPEATVVRLNARSQLRFRSGFFIDLRAQAQQADAVLLAYENFVAGNLSIGRGYDPASLQGDSGWGVAAEAGFSVRPIYGVSSQIYAFYDTAHVDNRSTGGLDWTIHSNGIGARFFFPHNVRLDLTYARPLDKLDPTALTKPDDRWLVALSTYF